MVAGTGLTGWGLAWCDGCTRGFDFGWSGRVVERLESLLISFQVHFCLRMCDLL